MRKNKQIVAYALLLGLVLIFAGCTGTISASPGKDYWTTPGGEFIIPQSGLEGTAVVVQYHIQVGETICDNFDDVDLTDSSYTWEVGFSYYNQNGAGKDGTIAFNGIDGASCSTAGDTTTCKRSMTMVDAAILSGDISTTEEFTKELACNQGTNIPVTIRLPSIDASFGANLRLEHYLDVSSWNLPSGAEWGGSTFHELGDTIFLVRDLDFELKSASVSSAAGQKFRVPAYIEAEDTKTDLAKMYISVLRPSSNVDAKSASRFEKSNLENPDLVPTQGDQADEVVDHLCENFPDVCEDEENLKAEYGWTVFEAPMNALLTDANPDDHEELHLFMYSDITFETEQFFSGEQPILVMPGIASNIPDIAEEDNAPYWLMGQDVEEVSLSSGARDAMCENMNTPIEMFVGEERLVSLTMRNPNGNQQWDGDGADFGLQLFGASGHLAAGWDLPATLALDDGEVVSTGDSRQFFFKAIAPEAKGEHGFRWRMAPAAGSLFAFGQECKYKTYVSDRVIPGWKVAYSGTGFPAHPLGGIEVRNGDVRISANSAIVSDDITIPEDSEYVASVTTNCGEGSVSIKVLEGGSEVPGTASFDAAESRQSFTTGTLGPGRIVNLLITSSKTEEGCTVIDDVAFHKNEENMNEAAFFTSTTAAHGCCPEGQCWNGMQCVGETGPEDTSTALGCMEGQWVDRYEHDDYFGENTGFCNLETDCFSHANSRCVPTGTYEGDFLCADGDWTTRTGVVASQLVAIAPSTDYTLFCGKPRDALNFIDYAPYFDGSLLGSHVSSILQCGAADTGDPGCANVNNMCVLEFLSGGEIKTVIGTSMNSDIEDDDPSNGGMLLALGETLASCSLARNGDYFYTQCGTDDVDLYYENQTETILFTLPGAVSFSSMHVLNDLFAVAGWSAVEAQFDKVRSVVQGFSEPGYDGADFYGFTDNLDNYDNLYYSTWAGKSVFGLTEAYNREFTSGEATSKARTHFVGVLYDGFSEDLCGYLSTVGHEDLGFGYFPQNACNDPEHGCCYNSERAAGLATDEYLVAEEAAAISIDPTQFGVFKHFNDLTAKVRIQ